MTTIPTDPNEWRDIVLAISHIFDTGDPDKAMEGDDRRFKTAIALARHDGVKTPLGLAIVYDTYAQGGWQVVSDSTRADHGRVGESVDEVTWLATFLDEREEWLNLIADRFEAKGKLENAEALRISLFRVDELRELLNAGNFNLTGIFTVRGNRLVGIATNDPKEDKPEDPAPEAPAEPLPDPINDAEAAGFRSSRILTVEIDPNTDFTAIWKFKNTGDTTWGDGYAFGHIRAFHPRTTGYPNTSLGSSPWLNFTQAGAPRTVKPGETVEFFVQMRAPNNAGMHASHWTLYDPNGKPFGPVRWVAIGVKDLTPPPEPEPLPPPQPGEQPAPDLPPTHPSGLIYTGPKWAFGHTLRGIHDRANRHPEPADHAIARGKFESVKVQTGTSPAEMKGYAPTKNFYFCRLYHSWGNRFQTVDDFLKSVMPDMDQLVQAGVKYFEFHNEPNLTTEGLRAAGVRGSWSNGHEFAQFFIEGRNKLQRKYPDILVGFPGLSPGGSTEYHEGHDHGFRMDSKEFLRQARPAVEAADFFCLHAYYQNMGELRGETMNHVKAHRRMFPDKLMFITEFSNPVRQGVSMRDKGVQAKAFYEEVSKIPGVGAAYYFIISGASWDHQSLRNGAGQSTGFMEGLLG
jgi:hypothetical protein